MDTLCPFCLQSSVNPKPHCLDNPGEGCTYGMHHEFPGTEFAKPKKAQPIRKVDKQLCTKCGLHVKNPASASNGCEHEYPSELS